MSNVLKVSHQEAIRSLYQKGWSQRRIGRELGINRRTVRRYIEGEAQETPFRSPARRLSLGSSRRFWSRTMGPPEPVRAL